MRVLVLSSVYPSASQPTFGVFVQQRTRALAAHCDVEVVAPVPWFPFNRMLRGAARSGAPHEASDGNLRVHHPRVFSIPAVGKSFDALFYFLSLIAFLRRLRRRFPFDVIDAHFTYPDGVAGVLLGRVLGCPVVITMRGNEALAERFRLRRWQMSHALRRAGVIALSTGLRDLALRLGAPAATIIPNGVDTSLFRPRDRNSARAALQLPQDRCIIVSVGAFIREKGHEVLLDALPALRRKLPNVLYVAVGNPAGGESRLRTIEERIRQRGLADCVRLAVARPHEEIALWLAAADVFCLATQREGSPNAILEALACGVPVVATDIPAVRELIRDGENGYLVPRIAPEAFAATLMQALERKWNQAAISRMATRSWQSVGSEAAAVLKLAADTFQSRA